MMFGVEDLYLLINSDFKANPSIFFAEQSQKHLPVTLRQFQGDRKKRTGDSKDQTD